MTEKLVTYGLSCTVYLLEAVVLFFLLYRRHGRRLRGVLIYLIALIALDGIGRSYVLYRFGLSSREYAYFFWLTDVLLALAAFLLVCVFFRRACLPEPKMWHFLRLLLSFVFILVLGISISSLLHNYGNLFSRFIVEFQQNLYFTCLVLTTLLFLLIQWIQSADEELALLVVGLGIQFAGPAANFALVTLTPGRQFASVLYAYLGPLCTLGMLLTWLYAVARVPEATRVPAREGRFEELEAVPSRRA